MKKNVKKVNISKSKTINFQDQSFQMALSFDDVLLIPKYSKVESRTQVDLTTEIAKGIELKIPIISTNMDSITGVKMAVELGKLGGIGILPRFEPIESQADKVFAIKAAGVLCAASVGIKEGSKERADALVKAGIDVLNVDAAHGHLNKSLELISYFKNKYGKKIVIMTGIAATGDCANDMYLAGSDCVLAGVGGSPICSTRLVTGCGLPTLASLLDIKTVARKHKKTFMPCAGIRNSGDMVKSFAAGASGVVCGFFFAGLDESPGDLIKIGEKFFKEYHGSTSEHQKKKHVERDPKDKSENYTIQIEGISSLVEYKGALKPHLEKTMAGIRSGFSYCGAVNIREMWEKAQFVRITNAGIIENGAHDVIELKTSESNGHNSNKS